MTHNLKKTFAILLLAIFTSTILHNCEPDPDSLGEQLFTKDQIDGTETSYEVIAYNIKNNDSIRSDVSRLITGVNAAGLPINVGVLGSFTEKQFGMQKASYITQLRMPSDNFDFNGPNPKVDSVVLVLRTPANTTDNTYYISDSIKAPGAYDRDDYPVGDEKVAVSIEKKSYPVRKYGKIGGASKSMTINVHEITTFLDTNINAFKYSNVNVNTGALLGSANFDGNVSTITVTKKSDNTNLLNGNLGFRMKLSNTDFFQTQIVDKKGKPELQDASNFIRHFKGIKISVSESDKYLFQFSPDDTELIMYYKYDKIVDGKVTRPQAFLKFNLGNPNAHIGQYEYDRTESDVSYVVPNSTTGDAKLYVQGMGGPSIAIKFKDEELDKLRKKLKEDKIGIIGAKIRVYVDPLSFANVHSAEGDRKFTLVPPVKTVEGVKQYTFTSDLMNGFPLYYYGKKTTDRPEYYDLTVTKTLKDIIEKEDPAYPTELYLNAGAFVRNAQGALVGAQYTTRATDMNRVVLTGNDKLNANRIQLRVTYGTKK